MEKLGFGLCLAAMAAIGIGSGLEAGDGSAFDHGDWSEVLSRFVDERGRVDYEALAGDRSALERYLERVAESGPRSTPDLFPTEADRLAYYVNAYNALVFQGVLDGYLDADSVWRGAVSGYGFFVGRKFRLDGRSINLRKLENQVVRTEFGDARIHAALNCASLGCPRLPATAFEPGRLERELDEAMAEFVSNEQNVRVDEPGRTLFLSKIFDWFGEDFIADEREFGNPRPSLIAYINRYRRDAEPIPDDYRVRFLEYDKRINRQPDDAGP